MNKEQLYIIKIGGNILDDEVKLNSFLNDFSSISGKKILVHGGGKLATAFLQQLGIETKMLNGRRITDRQTLQVITMVYAGWINKSLVAKLNALHCPATGLCGADNFLLPAEKRKQGEVDFGFVGDVLQNETDANKIRLLMEAGGTLVIAPLTSDINGQLLNMNADTVATALAVTLSALYTVQLVYCFEKEGLLLDAEDENTLVKEVNEHLLAELKMKGSIHSGMIPKVENALLAAKSGIQIVKMGKAEKIKSLIATKHETGTLICC